MVKPGYKQTEIGVIPEDWEVLPFKNVTKRVTVGIACSATHAYCNDGVAMLRNQNIQPNHLDDKEIVHIDEEFANRFAVKSLKEGDLLTARTGYPGTTCVVDSKYAGAQSFTTLISTPDTDRVISYFLSIYMNSQYGMNFFSGAQIGGAQKNVNAHTLATMPVVLPSKIEQEFIVQYLLDMDQLIQLYEKQIVKKKAIKQGTMQELLTGKKRLSGFDGRWISTKIGYMTDVYAGGTPNTSEPRYWGGSIPWMNSGELNLKIVRRVEGRITTAGMENSSTRFIPAECVLIGLAGQGRTRGTAAFNIFPLCTNQSIAAIYPNPNQFDSKFMYYVMDTQYEKLRELSSGDGGRGGLNKKLILDYEVFIPKCIDEQKAIARCLTEIDDEIEILEKKLLKYRQVKQGMMQQLLTGRIRLK